MTVEKTVVEKIKQIREMKKVSIEELASRSGMELVMIQKIEQEKNILVILIVMPKQLIDRIEHQKKRAEHVYIFLLVC